MTTAAHVDIGSLIESIPGVYGGRPRLARSGFPIIQLVAELRGGETIEGVMRRFELDPESAYAGLAYYLANKAALDQELDERNALGRELQVVWEREHGEWLEALKAKYPAQ
jgi:uncharacterized protein (DUF433 family)